VFGKKCMEKEKERWGGGWMKKGGGVGLGEDEKMGVDWGGMNKRVGKKGET
jgi:hypothetical protein